MQAMVLHEPQPVEQRPLVASEVEAPRPAPDEIIVDVSTCGVCRTDLHLVEGELTDPLLPVIPGHQVIGRVRQAGSAVRRFQPGDRVGVAWVNRFCGQCDYCVEGRENLCEAPTFTGFQQNGGFAEQVLVPAAFAHPIPDALGDDVHAAPFLCAGIIGYRALKQSGLRPGSRLGLYGFGAAAHIAIQIARAWGCEVFVFSRGEGSRRRALNLGAAWAGTSEEMPPRRLDHAVSFAPAGALIPDALGALRRGGTLAIAGIYVDHVPALDYERHLFQERTLVSTTANTRADARELLALAANLGIHTDVTTFPLGEANEALLHLKTGRLGAQAAVLQVG